ncbi:hypothetical protein [Haloarcula amylovorans]|uniref:hypothetical protein n=1 Tax=Haloarcula amylovorans TaxID=2562280 RepID=UPI00107662A0|nr:hypothetical protein [Halomicroarcula amylolytica]
MVGPSITAADRERFLIQLKAGFALLVGGSMALVTLWGGADLLMVVGIGIGATIVGGILAEFTVPDSIAETPFDDNRERGPKPGTRTKRRRAREDDDSEEQPARTDGDGR